MFGKRHKFKLCKGARYIRDFIGYDRYKLNFLREPTMKWEKNIGTITKIAGKYCQENNATVERAIKLYWIFLQRVTSDTWDAF